jgi:hypothetical protein
MITNIEYLNLTEENKMIKLIGSSGNNAVVRLDDGRKIQTTKSDHHEKGVHAFAEDMNGELISVVINWEN